MCHFSFRNVVFDNEMKVLLVFRRHGITALFTDAPVVVNGSGLSHSTGIRTSGAARGPSKGSLALILPTAWVPSQGRGRPCLSTAPGLRALCSMDT